MGTDAEILVEELTEANGVEKLSPEPIIQAQVCDDDGSSSQV